MKCYTKDQLDYSIKFSLGMLGVKHKQEVLEFILSKYDYIGPAELLLLAEDAYFKIKQLEYQRSYRATLKDSIATDPKRSLWYKLKNILCKPFRTP